MTKKQISDRLLDLMTWKQSLYVRNWYGTTKDGLPELKFDTFFKRTLKITKNKTLVMLAQQGLELK